MSAKPQDKATSIRLPVELKQKVQAIANQNHLGMNDVIRLCLFKVLPLIEKEGITIKPGKAS